MEGEDCSAMSKKYQQSLRYGLRKGEMSSLFVCMSNIVIALYICLRVAAILLLLYHSCVSLRDRRKEESLEGTHAMLTLSLAMNENTKNIKNNKNQQFQES